MWAYLKLAPYAVILILLAALDYYRFLVADRDTDIATLTASNETLKATNDQQQKTINKMVELREAEQKILLDLSTNIDTINDNVSSTQKSVSDLEQSNDDVKAYLANKLPDDLNRLLNK